VYSAGFGISNNKRGESTHGQSKPRTLDYGQAYFSILARHFAIQITLWKITTPSHPNIWLDIVMQIGSVTLRIGDPPQGLYS